jgi:bacteriocin-like protein
MFRRTLTRVIASLNHEEFEMEKKKIEKPSEQPQAKELTTEQLDNVNGGLGDIYTQVGKLPLARTQFVE